MGVDREIRSVRAFARFRAVSRDACGDDMISVVARRVRRIASSLRAREDATTDVPLVPRYRRRDISNTDRLRARTRHDRRGRIGRFGQSTHRGERYFFESRLVVCPPPHTHRRAHRRKEINHSIVDESIDERVARTFTASLLRRRRRRRRGRAVHGHRPGVASHASTHRSADRRRIDSTRCAATRLDDRARVVLRGWWSMVR